MHSGKDVARQCPRCGSPDNQRTIGGVNQRKQNVNTRVRYFTITLSDFPGRQCGTALSPPPDDFVALIKQTTVKQVFQTPPDTLNITLVVCHIRLFQIHPETEPACQLLPLLHVSPDALLTFLDEWLFSVCFYFFLAVNAEFFANFDFHWQTMSIPASFAFAAETSHCFVTWKDIFDAAGQAVARVRHAVGGRRTLIKDKRGTVLAASQRFPIDFVLVPEFQDLLFQSRETGTGGESAESRHGQGCKIRSACVGMHCQAEISNQHVIQDLWDKNGDESKAKAMRKQDCTVLVPKRRGQD